MHDIYSIEEITRPLLASILHFIAFLQVIVTVESILLPVSFLIGFSEFSVTLSSGFLTGFVKVTRQFKSQCNFS